MSADNTVPLPPEITEEQLATCRKTGDFRPVLFEWYKYVGLVCNFYASIRSDSPAIREIPRLHYAVLVGLLNRCSRLMLANVALSHEGLFGETTAILDRCIFESVIKTIWLCKTRNEEGFIRYIADGLKTEIEFKNQLEKIISERGGGPLVIEARMLDSIKNYIAISGLSEDVISNAKKLPDLASMIQTIGGDRLQYVIGQRIGSHHVHGTWPSLWLHYLRKDGTFAPRDHNCPTHVNQYVFTPIFVLDAVLAFVQFISDKADDVDGLSKLPSGIKEEIMKLNARVIGKDFDEIEI
jgi:hypothetical protein